MPDEVLMAKRAFHKIRKKVDIGDETETFNLITVDFLPDSVPPGALGDSITCLELSKDYVLLFHDKSEEETPNNQLLALSLIAATTLKASSMEDSIDNSVTALAPSNMIGDDVAAFVPSTLVGGIKLALASTLAAAPVNYKKVLASVAVDRVVIPYP